MDQSPEGGIPIDQFQQAETAPASPPGAIPVDQFEAAGGDKSSEPIPIDQFQSHEFAYGNKSQQAIAGLEGAAQGIVGPLAPYIETKMGVDPADIAGRQAENPTTHALAEAGAFAGSSMLGVGEAGLLAKAIPKFASLGKVGSMALRGGLEMAALQGGDEATKKLIQPPDPNDSTAETLAHVGYAGLLGAATGGMFGAIDKSAMKGLKYVEDSKLAKRAQSWLSGFGAATQGQDTQAMGEFIDAGLEHLDKTAFKSGANFHKNMADTVAKTAIDKATEIATGTAGYHLSGPLGGYLGYQTAKRYVEPVVEKILAKPVTAAAQKYVVPMLTKVLTSDSAKAVPAAVEYAAQCLKGSQKITSGLNAIFKSGGQQALEAGVDQLKKDKISKGIDNSILDQQLQNQTQQQNTTPQFAEGGKVAPMQQSEDHFANSFPQENMILQTARGRVYQHLKALKPQKSMNALPFDSNQITPEQHRTYNDALDLAASPLHVLKHIKDGTLDSTHMAHMSKMWPELTNHLSKKLTERITQAQLKGDAPNYNTRKGLSIFLGTPLDSTMKPQSIVAAQATFTPKQTPGQPPQQQGKKKGSPSKMNAKMPNMYKTPNEAAESDRSDRS